MKNLILSMGALAIDSCNGMITVMWFTKCNCTMTTIEDEITNQSGREVVKEGFKLLSLDGRHHCSAVRRVKADGGFEWTDRQPLNTQAFRQKS